MAKAKGMLWLLALTLTVPTVLGVQRRLRTHANHQHVLQVGEPALGDYPALDPENPIVRATLEVLGFTKLECPSGLKTVKRCESVKGPQACPKHSVDAHPCHWDNNYCKPKGRKCGQEFFEEMMSIPETAARSYIATLRTFKTALDGLGNSQTHTAAVKEFMRGLLELLSLQNAGDPFMFVSHSATHGIRVLAFALQAFEAIQGSPANPPVYNQVAFGRDLRTRNKRAKAAVMISNILHDVGYGGKLKLNGQKLDLIAAKYLHSVVSADFVNVFLGDAIKALFGKPGGKILRAIVNSVGTHNFDVQGHHTNTALGCDEDGNNNVPASFSIYVGAKRLQYFKGDCTTNARSKGAQFMLKTLKTPVDITVDTNYRAGKRNGIIARTYTKGLLHGGLPAQQLQTFLRFADNMDSARDRLLKPQTSPDFMIFLAWMYNDDRFRQDDGNGKAQLPKPTASEHKGEYWGIDVTVEGGDWKCNTKDPTATAHWIGTKHDDDTDLLEGENDNRVPAATVCDGSSKFFNAESFLHFYSNWKTRSSVLSVRQTPAGVRWILTVTLNPDETWEASLRAAVPVYYQIQRAADACGSLVVKKGQAGATDETVNDMLLITVVKEGAAEGSFFPVDFPLRVFSPKTVQSAEDFQKFKQLYPMNPAGTHLVEQFNGVTPAQPHFKLREFWTKVRELKAEYEPNVAPPAPPVPVQAP